MKKASALIIITIVIIICAVTFTSAKNAAQTIKDNRTAAMEAIFQN